jgi:DNA polymerase-3 subunit alpha
MSIDKIIKLCKDNNLDTIALVDDDLTSTMKFYKECLNNNIKPIIGLDVKIDNLSVLLYAKDYTGYQTLIKLSSLKYDHNLSLEDLKEYKKEVICILPFDSISLYEDVKNIYKDLYLGYQDKGEEK